MCMRIYLIAPSPIDTVLHNTSLIHLKQCSGRLMTLWLTALLDTMHIICIKFPRLMVYILFYSYYKLNCIHTTKSINNVVIN